MSIASIRAHRASNWIGNTKLWRCAGTAGFAFFFIKGLLWLLVPLTWYAMK